MEPIQTPRSSPSAGDSRLSTPNPIPQKPVLTRTLNNNGSPGGSSPSLQRRASMQSGSSVHGSLQGVSPPQLRAPLDKNQDVSLVDVVVTPDQEQPKTPKKQRRSLFPPLTEFDSPRVVRRAPRTTPYFKQYGLITPPRRYSLASEPSGNQQPPSPF